MPAGPSTDVLPADVRPPDVPQGPARGRRLALVLWAATGLAVLAGGLLLWHDRAELVFLDMVAGALAMCF